MSHSYMESYVNLNIDLSCNRCRSIGNMHFCLLPMPLKGKVTQCNQITLLSLVDAKVTLLITILDRKLVTVSDYF